MRIRSFGWARIAIMTKGRDWTRRYSIHRALKIWSDNDRSNRPSANVSTAEDDKDHNSRIICGSYSQYLKPPLTLDYDPSKRLIRNLSITSIWPVAQNCDRFKFLPNQRRSCIEIERVRYVSRWTPRRLSSIWPTPRPNKAKINSARTHIRMLHIFIVYSRIWFRFESLLSDTRV